MGNLRRGRDCETAPQANRRREGGNRASHARVKGKPKWSKTMSEPNTFGGAFLDNVMVDVTFPDGTHVDLELQIEPSLIVQGLEHDARPGVSYNPECYDRNPFANAPEDVGDVIAYAINEGGILSDEIESDDGLIRWSVRNSKPLFQHNVLD
jgi:hypothetical protein